MNLVVIITLSLFISLIWLYYLKLIDVFENEKIIYIGITFVTGTIIPNIIYPIHDLIYNPFGIGNSSNPVLSFLFFTFGVGLLEEIIKLIPVLIILRFAKKAINEPLDYVVYACVSALGFAFGENVEYAWFYGHDVLLGRSVLSVPAHMFFSALFVYGYVLYKYNRRPAYSIFLYGGLGFLAHGLYDYLLDLRYESLGQMLTIVFFMLLISVFITILNNALNNSPHYTPQKTVDQQKVRTRLTTLYVVALLAVFIYYTVRQGLDQTLDALIWFVLFKLFILGIIIIRLSRFSIIPGEWKPARFEFPFVIDLAPRHNDLVVLFGLLRVKGESYNDYHLSLLFGEEIMVVPLSATRGSLQKAHKGVIEQKLFLNGQPVFVLKLRVDRNTAKHYLLVAKTAGTTHLPDNTPIASLNSVNSTDNKMIFHEWVILKKTI